MDGITTLDYILLPFYLLIIYKIAFHYRDKYYPPGHNFRPYFISGLTAKIAGAIFIGLIYNYYYHGGDTFNYFFHSKIINSTFSSTPDTWFRLITHQGNTSVYADAQAMGEMYWYDDGSAYVTSCLGALVGILCFTKYLVINVIIAALSFIGMWLMFVTFASQYQNITKYIAIAVLFMPGPVIWGSGLFKDSFCMFAIGSLVYCTYVIFEKRHISLRYLLLTMVSILTLALVKMYILIALMPILIFKTMLVYKKSLASHPERKVIFYLALLLFAYGCYKVSAKAMVYLSNYTVENVLQTIETQKNYLLNQSLSQDGSAYDLGNFEPTVTGISKMIIPAINVTLFRPYIWESRKLIQLFSAFESAGVLLFTLYLFIKNNILTIIKRIYHDPNLIICLFFTLTFAFFVGVSSYNFGTLSRYKIPCIPFYVLFLVILIFNKENQTEKSPN